MNLRTKIFLLIGGTLILFFSAIIIFTSYKLTNDFSRLEQDELRKNLDRATDALNEKIDNLAIKLGDWAQWDDSYQFIDDQNEEYLQSNLQNNAFDTLDINFVVLMNKEKQIIYKKFVKDGEEQPFPESFSEHLVEDFTEGDINLDADHHEIVAFPEDILIYAAEPITSSDGLSPANGVIVFGYIFNESHAEALSQLTHLKISMAHFADTIGKNDEFDIARQNLSVDMPHFLPQTKSSQVISGYILVSDATKEPVFIFRVDMPRDIYQKGQESIFLFILFIVLTGLFFCAIIFYLLGRFVLSKISYLNTAIDQIRQSGKKDKSIILPGADEFSLLAGEMNRLLQEVNQNEMKLKEQNKDLGLSKKAALNILEDVTSSEKELQEKTLDLAKFQQIADTSFDHIIITDIEGKVLYANHSAETLTGYSQEEMMGENPSIWGKQMSQEFYENLWQTIKIEKESFAGEVTNRRKNGQSYLAAVRITPILDEQGMIQFFVGIERDITEERQAQMRIIEHSAELETANSAIEKQKDRAESILGYLQSIGEGVFATDTTGKIIFVNETARVLVGDKRKEMREEKSKDLFHFIQKTPNESVRVFMAEKVLKKNHTLIFPDNTFLVKMDGTELPVSGTISLIQDSKEVIIGTIAVFQDITRQYELDQMKNSFLSVAAHQLRTPLGSMRWSMEMLLSNDLGKLPKDAKEMVEQLYSNSQRMVMLVDDLLDISRIDKNRGKEEKVPTDIVSVINSVLETMKSESEKRAIKIVFRHPKESIPAIMAPQKHLYEAFENLVSNGIKYNKEKGNFIIVIEIKKESILLTFTDTGIGIPKNDQTKIFSKFFRAQNAVIKETEGSGLGLSVVKSYLEESDATVRFESEENVGTTFFVEFPFTSTKS
ncbi:MAG: CHASE4 domain-containing protein [Candidatus Moraniibacteriota bacterium]